MKKFTIDEQYLTDVFVKVERDYIKDRNNPTHDDLIKILMGQDKSYWSSNKDHDEFTKLREELEKLGYIHIERGWWNGDRVKKSFKLNDMTFKKGDTFYCASALGIRMQVAKNRSTKR